MTDELIARVDDYIAAFALGREWTESDVRNAFVSGWHARDSEIAALRERNAELREILSALVACKKTYGTTDSNFPWESARRVLAKEE